MIDVPPKAVRNVSYELEGRNVSISWLPPLEKGSTGVIVKYYIQWGFTDYLMLNDVPLRLPALEQEGLDRIPDVHNEFLSLQILNFHFLLLLILHIGA